MKAFEAMLVSQLLQPLFSGVGNSLFGEGVQGDIHRSLFSDAVAEALVRRGGLGLGKYW